MIIQHNLSALNANRQFGIINKKKVNASQKLASGYKINRSADDAAGLAISEKMRRQIRGLNQAAANLQDGISYVQVAEGALNEAHDMLQRMNELAVQSANGTNDATDREYIDAEVQHIKEELNRIFDTTSFNSKKIWDIDANVKQQIGTEIKQAVTINWNSSRLDITNDNCGVVAFQNYTINADTSGINVSWTGYDGNQYRTETIDWNTLKANNYSVELSDYFGANSNLYDSNGNPVFKYNFAFSPAETATIDNMITCLDGRTMQSTVSPGINIRFEKSDGNEAYNPGRILSHSLNYGAFWASNMDFNPPQDTFMQPIDSNDNIVTYGSTNGNLTGIPSAITNNDLNAAKTSTDVLEFSFNLDGIGKVKVTSDSISYNSQNVSEVYSTAYGSGTLGSFMAALTGDPSSAQPGILGDDRAHIYINFKITSEQSYTYAGNQTTNEIGSLRYCIDLSSTDTEQDVFTKISNAFNSNTILDFYTSTSGFQDNATIHSANPKVLNISVPIYTSSSGVVIQAGAEADAKIKLAYDALSTTYLGIQDTNVLTPDDCYAAISAIDNAMQIVSAQRSDFGAYQNRMEHAYNNNKNIEENTQAAESQIRDTNMALTMVEFSNLNILQQAGQSMLAQANSSQQAILHLLQS